MIGDDIDDGKVEEVDNDETDKNPLSVLDVSLSLPVAPAEEKTNEMANTNKFTTTSIRTKR